MDLNAFESVRKLRKTAFKYCCGIALGLTIFLLLANIVFYENLIWYLVILTIVYSISFFYFQKNSC